ncbi:hypothetical protein WKV53_17220 [Luteolibacter sp. Y139]|uniref:Uncharacterized protein n=1 Tax=Luteolibacter soli TaxID=3135280 RepID=A0ABU9AWX5_9BACT
MKAQERLDAGHMLIRHDFAAVVLVQPLHHHPVEAGEALDLTGKHTDDFIWTREVSHGSERTTHETEAGVGTRRGRGPTLVEHRVPLHFHHPDTARQEVDDALERHHPSALPLGADGHMEGIAICSPPASQGRFHGSACGGLHQIKEGLAYKLLRIPTNHPGNVRAHLADQKIVPVQRE